MVSSIGQSVELAETEQADRRGARSSAKTVARPAPVF